MATKSATKNSPSPIWDRVIQFEKELTPTAASALLTVQFSGDDRSRLAELSAKARAGTLSADEERECDVYERLGAVLDILHAKARRVLKQRRTT